MRDIIKMGEYRCKWIKEEVSAQRDYDTGEMIVGCNYYTVSPFGENKCPCFFDKLSPQSCLVKKSAEKKERKAN